MTTPSCPHCHRDDGAYPLARITQTVVTWLCAYCRLTFDVRAS